LFVYPKVYAVGVMLCSKGVLGMSDIEMVRKTWKGFLGTQHITNLIIIYALNIFINLIIIDYLNCF
jgi:hypothetical protein